MNLIHKIEVWGDSHHPRSLDVVRIALGVFLLMKGVAFMENSTGLKSLIEDQNEVSFSQNVLTFLMYYVTFAHLVGGAMIALGTLTRFASIIQIPIVLAAVFLTSFFISPVNTMMWPSVIALVLLVLFTIIGSGPLSLDRYVSDLRSADEL